MRVTKSPSRSVPALVLGRCSAHHDTCRRWLAAAAGLALAACGGSSSGSEFTVLSVSVPENATWPINRPIEIRFSRPVDFGTVDMNTISIARADGGPATGEFSTPAGAVDPTTVVFQPACPTLDDFSDAGLSAGGVQYTLHIPVAGDGGAALRAADGTPLSTGAARSFVTPTGTALTTLFIDTRPGPPLPVVHAHPGSTEAEACRLEIGDDAQHPVYFFASPTPDPELGAAVPEDFRAPLDLYSDPNTHVAAVIVLDQPIDPTASNRAADRIRLEYLEGTQWIELGRSILLDANCTQTGARLRLVPAGILPQGRTVRIVLAHGFRDIVGDAIPFDVTLGSFTTGIAVDPGTTTHGDEGDEYLEEFGGAGSGSLEDTTTPLDSPRAAWGAGKLAATLSFEGSGGPGGHFDWHVHPLAGGAHTLFNTDFQVIVDDPLAPTATQNTVGGRVDVHDLVIDPGAVLELRGPNPFRLVATGTITIDGTIVARGFNAPQVLGFPAPTPPTQPGAPGNCGGGRGGTGNANAAFGSSTPIGGTGFGAFDAPGGGGVGGESGYSASGPVARRGGGGGGGRFGLDVPRLNADGTISTTCPDQSRVGLDAESGAHGSPSAFGAITRMQPPAGGTPGPFPVPNAHVGTGLPQPEDLDEFWGTMVVGGRLVNGALSQLWAGEGGGAGGSACATSSFPTTPWLPSSDNRGAGGGGGGGAIVLLALGDIRFGTNGSINASGGAGAGGQNTNGYDRIGGASGGGSGGHVILQSASHIDFRACNPANGAFTIVARGGEGGAGANDAGGFGSSGVELPPNLDMLPPDAYGATAACPVQGNSVGVVDGCGGDGGPGVIQLHAPTLADILKPNATTLSQIVVPNPVGSSVALTGTTPGTLNWNEPTTWNALLPAFGRTSKALSKWIALGAAGVEPDSPIPHAITFAFGGLDEAGLVATSGSGADAIVHELPPVFAGSIAAEPALPFVAADGRTLVLDAAALSDDIYARNPFLLRRFELQMTHGAAITKLDVAGASLDPTTGVMRITVAQSGTPLSNFGPNSTVALIPRFFRVATNEELDSLPGSSSIRIELQAAPAIGPTGPDEEHATAWTSRAADLVPSSSSAPLRYLRFRVTFDVAAGGSTLSPDAPRPSLDFLRVPFRF